jgi:hypothetical protein
MVSTKDKKEQGTVLGSIFGGIGIFMIILSYFLMGSAQTHMAIDVAKTPLPSDLKKPPYGPAKQCGENLLLAALKTTILQAFADATAQSPVAVAKARAGRPGSGSKTMRGGGMQKDAEETVGSIMDWFSTGTVGWPYDSCGAGLGIGEWFGLSMKWAWAKGRELLSLAIAWPILNEQRGKASSAKKSAIQQKMRYLWVLLMPWFMPLFLSSLLGIIVAGGSFTAGWVGGFWPQVSSEESLSLLRKILLAVFVAWIPGMAAAIVQPLWANIYMMVAPSIRGLIFGLKKLANMLIALAGAVGINIVEPLKLNVLEEYVDGTLMKNWLVFLTIFAFITISTTSRIITVNGHADATPAVVIISCLYGAFLVYELILKKML